MSGRSTVAPVSSSMQQRLQWKPLKGTAFRQKEYFITLLQMYSFATGKKYVDGFVNDKEKEALYFCAGCRKGRIRLYKRRRNASTSWWIVRRVITCNCGDPPDLLQVLLQSNDLSALVGRSMSRDCGWMLLAKACFPGGYINTKTTQREWSICCKREKCSGQIDIKRTWVHGMGYSRYDDFDIVAAIDCSSECKEAANEDIPLSCRIAQPDVGMCPICMTEQLHEWVRFPCCSARLCYNCFAGLALTCPIGMQSSSLAVFDLENQCRKCPFCREKYTPNTMVWYYRRNESAAICEMVVRNLVKYPYAYQNFNRNMPTGIMTQAKYAAVQRVYEAHQARKRMNRILQSQDDARRGRLPAETITRLLDAVSNDSNDDYGRLQVLRQSKLFDHHRIEFLNFIDAVEFLHQKDKDGGFLRRVADANAEEQRLTLVRNAYEIGWNCRNGISAQNVVSLLERNHLIEVIDLTDD